MVGNSMLGMVMSFIAMAFVMISYFVKNKKMYLVFQTACIIFLVLSYLVIGQFFAMIGLSISLIRALVFFLYENKDKRAPIWISVVISIGTCVAYIIVNLIILKTARPVDLLLLSSSIMYAFIFRVRNLELVRYTMLLPTVLSVLYNALISAPIFLVLSYGFEGVANIVSIFRYHLIPKYRAHVQNKDSVTPENTDKRVGIK